MAATTRDIEIGSHLNPAFLTGTVHVTQHTLDAARVEATSYVVLNGNFHRLGVAAICAFTPDCQMLVMDYSLMDEVTAPEQVTFNHTLMMDVIKQHAQFVSGLGRETVYLPTEFHTVTLKDFDEAFATYLAEALYIEPPENSPSWFSRFGRIRENGRHFMCGRVVGDGHDPITTDVHPM